MVNIEKLVVFLGEIDKCYGMTWGCESVLKSSKMYRNIKSVWYDSQFKRESDLEIWHGGRGRPHMTIYPHDFPISIICHGAHGCTTIGFTPESQIACLQMLITWAKTITTHFLTWKCGQVPCLLGSSYPGFTFHLDVGWWCSTIQ